MPDGRQASTGNLAQLRATLKQLKPKQSFIWGNNHEPYRAAYQIGAKIKTEKLNGGGYRVWLKKSGSVLI